MYNLNSIGTWMGTEVDLDCSLYEWGRQTDGRHWNHWMQSLPQSPEDLPIHRYLQSSATCRKGSINLFISAFQHLQGVFFCAKERSLSYSIIEYYDKPALTRYLKEDQFMHIKKDQEHHFKVYLPSTTKTFTPCTCISNPGNINLKVQFKVHVYHYFTLKNKKSSSVTCRCFN